MKPITYSFPFIIFINFKIYDGININIIIDISENRKTVKINWDALIVHI